MPFKDFTTEILTSADVDTYLMSQVIIRCTSSTRPSSPAQGWHIYETDTSRFMVYNGSSWVSEGATIAKAIKTVDESLTSSTTMQDDDQLFLPVEANTDYWIESHILFRSETTADLNIQPSYPSGTTFAWSNGAPATNDAGGNSYGQVWFQALTSTGTSTALVTIGGLSIGMAAALPLKGLLRVGANAGTFKFRWSQSVSNSNASTVHANSILMATKL